MAGDVSGSVLSGEFESAVAVGGGDAIDARGSQGAIIKPTGPISITIRNLIVYAGTVTVADVLDACRGQVESMVTEAKHKYDPKLYVHRAIEQELNQFFDTPLDAGAANCYLILAPAGSGKTNLLCHLAGERTGTQPVVLLMGGNLYLSPTSGLLGALQSELQTASRSVNFRSAEDCLHTLHRVAEETGRDALIILDAINEHDKPVEMRKAVEDLLRRTRGRRVKLVITCRDFYWGIFKGPFWEGTTVNPLPAEETAAQEGESASSEFSRFTIGEHQVALSLYLTHYRIVGRPIGDAAEQCRHPLLLRFFCEAYGGQEVGEVEDIRLKELFDRYWDQKLSSVAERIIRRGDERVQDVLQKELGDYLMNVAAYMLRNSVRAIPETEMPKATGLEERLGDTSSFYGRIRDEFIILEERERGQGYRRAVQVSFVYEEFMEYAMARSLLRDWEVASLDKQGILTAVDGLAAQYTSFAQVLGVMVYVGLMLREMRGITLWSALMSRGGPWRGVVLEAIRKLPDNQVDGNVFLVLQEVLDLQDTELTVRALDILKTSRFGRRAPRAVMQKVCDLSGHSDESIRRRVMLAIAKAPMELKRPAFERGLCDPRQGVRDNAIASTLGLGPESALGLLKMALHHKEQRIRSDAIAGLGHLGEPAVGLLVKALGDSDGEVRQKALEALVRIGAPSLKSLVAVLDDPAKKALRQQAIRVLGWLGDARALEPLATALCDPTNRNVRRQAAQALGQLGDRDALEPLVAALRDRSSDVRRESAKALKQLGWEPSSDVDRAWQAMALQDWVDCIRFGPVAVEPLEIALRDGKGNLRRQAARALGRLGDARALKSLAADLSDRDSKVRREAVEALGRLGDAHAVEPLVVVLRDADSTVRRQAAEALNQLGWQPTSDVDRGWHAMASQDWAGCVKLGAVAVEPLAVVLHDSDHTARRQAVETLGEIGDAHAVEPLTMALRDPDECVRGRATEALVKIGAPSVPALAVALRDADSTVRRQAAEALNQLGWEPSLDVDRGWLAVALHDWAGCVKLGVAAVQPLRAVLGAWRSLRMMSPMWWPSNMQAMDRRLWMMDIDTEGLAEQREEVWRAAKALAEIDASIKDALSDDDRQLIAQVSGVFRPFGSF